MDTLEPRLVDSRHLIDIDAGQRSVDLEGFVRQVGAVSERREPVRPAGGAIRQMAERPGGGRIRQEFFRQFTRARAERPPEPLEPAEPTEYYKESITPAEQKGRHLDIEA